MKVVGWILIVTWIAFLNYNVYLHERQFAGVHGLIENLENVDSSHKASCQKELYTTLSFRSEVRNAFSHHTKVLETIIERIGMKPKEGATE